MAWEWNDFRNEMTIVRQKLYLDHAAMSPLHPKVVNRIHEFHRERQWKGANFSYWWKLVDETRQLVADWINACPKQVAFLWNTSAGINLAAQGFPLAKGDEIIIPDKEFPSNVYPWLNVSKEIGIKVKTVPYRENTLTAEQIIESITPKTKLISVSWVNASNGNKIDIAKLGQYCKERGIYFVVDAIQGFGTSELNVSDVNVDLLVSGFFKWAMGPDGISFVYLSERALNEIRSPWIGWAGMSDRFQYEQINFEPAEDAYRFETGNMNFSAIAGVNESLRLLFPIRDKVYERIIMLAKRLRDGLSMIPSITLLSPRDNYSGITLFQGVQKEYYDKRNVVVNYRSGIRVSPHFYNTEEEIDYFLNVTEDFVFNRL